MDSFKLLLVKLIVILTVLGFQTTSGSIFDRDDDDGLPCTSLIYCHGKLLDTVQRKYKFYPDSKDFVDFPMTAPSDVILTKFEEIGGENASREAVGAFLNEYFDNRTADLPEYTPPDWQNVSSGGLPIYKQIKDESLRDFAQIIHGKWRQLGRQISKDIETNQDRHSLIYVPNPFIVPGGRFDEIYYWDSFWVIQGLLTSNMTETAKGMIMNMAHIIDNFGYMLNGNRIYYSKRSQPPLLAMIVDQYIRHPNVPDSGKLDLLRAIMPRLEKEHSFWIQRRSRMVTVNGTKYDMNVYRGGIKYPRPESYLEDYELAHAYFERTRQLDPKFLYANIAAAAESGWDFSTRWLDTRESPFETIRTETIIPVDLNSFLCAQERLMSEFYTKLGNTTSADKYWKMATTRGDSIQALMWNDAKSMYRDYDTQRNEQREHFYLSAVTPVFTQCHSATTNVTSTQFLEKLLNSYDLQNITSYPGGFPASVFFSRTNCCQWDLPNAWPPLVMMLIEGFAQNADLRPVALQWAQKWISAVHKGFLAPKGDFYEKYDVDVPGKRGFGGEYEVQVGFGWTNGGILRLLEMFPTELVGYVNNDNVTTTAYVDARSSAVPDANGFSTRITLNHWLLAIFLLISTILIS